MFPYSQRKMAPPTQFLEAELKASAEDEHSLFLDSGESSLQLSKAAEREQEELLDAAPSAQDSPASQDEGQA